MTPESINLLSEEAAQKPYWDQYWTLLAALEKTKKVLAALGVEEFPTTQPKQPIKKPLATPAPTPTPTPSPDATSSGQPSLTAMVRSACRALRNDITRDAVLKWIAENHPGREVNRASVGVLLSSQMIEENVVTLVERGMGGQPNRYRVKVQIPE